LRADARREFTIGVNPKYLIDAIKGLASDRVTLAFGKESLDPMVVRSTDDATEYSVAESKCVAVIMPMRI
jgi:DNA polymerase III sliding clamp (beta) subunit (PCNA family)